MCAAGDGRHWQARCSEKEQDRLLQEARCTLWRGALGTAKGKAASSVLTHKERQLCTQEVGCCLPTACLLAKPVAVYCKLPLRPERGLALRL